MCRGRDDLDEARGLIEAISENAFGLKAAGFTVVASSEAGMLFKVKADLAP